MQWLLTAGLAYGGTSNETQSAHTCDDVEGADNAAELRLQAKRVRREERVKGSGTRATSMVYTQMLFALAGDKLVFGVSPTAMSWLGSGFILAGAIFVAAARDNGSKVVKDGRIELSNSTERRGKGDGAIPEETIGLMSGFKEEGKIGETEGNARRPSGLEIGGEAVLDRDTASRRNV